MNNIGNWWHLKISQEFVTSSLNGWIHDELSILMWNKNLMNIWDIWTMASHLKKYKNITKAENFYGFRTISLSYDSLPNISSVVEF